jgi:hypothetical protein
VRKGKRDRCKTRGIDGIVVKNWVVRVSCQTLLVSFSCLVCLLRLRLLDLYKNVKLIFNSVNVSFKIKAKVIYLVFKVVGCLND